jgi:hypothetical protein
VRCARKLNHVTYHTFCNQVVGGESRQIQFLSKWASHCSSSEHDTHTLLFRLQTIDNLPVHDLPTHQGHTNSFRFAITRINGPTLPASSPLRIPKWRQPPATEMSMHRPYHRDLEFPRKPQIAPESSLCLWFRRSRRIQSILVSSIYDSSVEV